MAKQIRCELCGAECEQSLDELAICDACAASLEPIPPVTANVTAAVS